MELCSAGVRIPCRVQKRKMKNMLEKFLSVSVGSVAGFISTIMTGKVIEVIILSFLGGVVGWFGGKAAKWIDKKCKCLFHKKEK
jgi:hypothetical protein